MLTLEEFFCILHGEILINNRVSVRLISKEDTENGLNYLQAFRFGCGIGGFLAEYASNKNLAPLYKILLGNNKIAEINL